MNYYNPYYQPMQMPEQIRTAQVQTPTVCGGGAINWVQGIEGAKAFLVAPGNTVLLMDSDGSCFYLKSADNSGMPMPLRVFDYKERVQAATKPQDGFGELAARVAALEDKMAQMGAESREEGN